MPVTSYQEQKELSKLMRIDHTPDQLLTEQLQKIHPGELRVAF